MARREQRIEHLLRRVGFGGSSDDISELADVGYHGAVDRLVFHELIADDVDSRIGQAGHVGVTTRSQFLPDTSINDARQRWLFRMVHSRKPLQEKMALFWHHHFATAHSKINGTYGGALATRMMAATGSYNGANQTPAGQIELFRHEGLGSFYTLLVAVARDPAMLVWLDGRLNVKGKPQENFAREVMELFTMGLRASDDGPLNFTEDDVKAAAEVFTGWNLSIGDRGTNNANDATVPYGFLYRADRHQDGPKTFSFDIYPDGGRTITSSGAQQGLDFLMACCRHPATGPRLVRKLYAFFVSDIEVAPQPFVDRVAAVYYATAFDLRRVMLAVLLSPELQSDRSYFAKYSWPVEFVARAIKETGWEGFSVDQAMSPLVAMGQQLYEPPDVNGWESGQGWFSTGGMLARMNFAATLTGNQRFNLREAARGSRTSPTSVLAFALDRLSALPFDREPHDALLEYLRAGTSWTGSDAELLTKTAGVMHLLMASPHYQFV